jgi:hypothetical protein
VRDVKKKIYEMFRPVIKVPSDAIHPDKKKHLSEDNLVEEEYKYFFENN